MARLSTLESGDNLSDLVDRVANGKERIVLTRAGKELVAIVPVEDLEIMEAMEERLDIEDARAARTEAQEKGTIPLAVLKKELGL
jgi:prevent-host-death family protein